MWGAGGSVEKRCKRLVSRAAAGCRELLLSCCISYQQHYYSSGVALAGEGTQAGTSF